MSTMKMTTGTKMTVSMEISPRSTRGCPPYWRRKLVKAAVVMHGANAANHIAAQGAMTAARHGATTDHAVVAVAAAADSLGARLAAPPSIVTSTDHVTVRVSVRVPQAVPVFAAEISREVSVPRERYIAYGER